MTMAGFQSLSPTGLRKRKSFDRGDDESEALSWEDMSISGHGDATMGQVDGRLERKSPDGDGSSKLCKAGWTDEEDSIVHVAVRALGTQWQAVADRLPGRTADAVRNRWHRLQKRGLPSSPPNGESLEQLTLAPSWCPDGADGAAAAPSAASAGAKARTHTLLDLSATGVSSAVVVTGSDHGRAKWSAEEDGAILQGVRTLGCRWREIAALLPGRSDSSIRNRWHRMIVRGQVTDETAAAASTQPAHTRDK